MIQVFILYSAAGPPVVGSAVNSATYFWPNTVVPGQLVSLFGQGLADCLGEKSGLPLPVEACGATVLVGGQPVPLLYAGFSQINFQMPFDIAVNTQSQLVVQRDSALSTPLTITIASDLPGVFTALGNGTGQGIVVNYATGQLAGTNSPVAPGGIIVVYCQGLGAVSPAVPTGAPVSTISETVNPVTLTVGGRNALVTYAGLTPGSVGLYQINAVVPAGVPSGDAVPVVIQVAGQMSPTVTIAVQ